MQKKIIVYTCIIGGYEQLRPLSIRMEEADYVCLTDNPHTKSDFWEIKYFDTSELAAYDSTLKNRYAKLLPHLFFPEYEFSVYLDGNIDIVSEEAHDKIQEYIDTGVRFSNAVHYQRNCVYEEAEACIQLKKDSPDKINQWVDFLKQQGYPTKNGLYANALIFRRHNDSVVKQLTQEWWQILTTYSKRDQLSLPYLFMKHNFTPEDWNEGRSPEGSNFFIHCKRRSHKKRKIGIARRLMRSLRKKMGLSDERD